MSYRRAYNLDKNLIFQELFNSEQETRKNGGSFILGADVVLGDEDMVEIMYDEHNDVWVKTGYADN